MYVVKGEFNHPGIQKAAARLRQNGGCRKAVEVLRVSCPVYGPDKNKTDGQAGAFRIPGALAFPFEAVAAVWTIRRSYPLQNAGF